MSPWVPSWKGQRQAPNVKKQFVHEPESLVFQPSVFEGLEIKSFVSGA